MFLTRSEYDRGVNTFSPEGRLFQVIIFIVYLYPICFLFYIATKTITITITITVLINRWNMQLKL